MENDNYLTKGELITGLFTISLPIIVSNLLQSVLEIVDMYFVGRLGAEALAGVAMSMTLMMVLATFVIGWLQQLLPLLKVPGPGCKVLPACTRDGKYPR